MCGKWPHCRLETAMFFLIPISFFVLTGFVLSIGINGWQRNRQLKVVADFNTRLLDKLGSVKDFGEFLQTEAGATFLHSFAAENPATSAPQRILRAAQTGVVLLCLGIGMLLLARLHTFTDMEALGVTTGLGVVATSLGIGYLVSAALSYRLAAMFGVLKSTQARVPVS